MSKVIMGNGGFNGCLSEPQGSLCSWRYCKRTPAKFGGEAERRMVRGTLVPLASGGGAAKTLFRASHNRQLPRLTSRCFSVMEGNGTSTCIRSFSLLVAESP